MVTVIVADDHDVIREGIKNILRDNPDFTVVAEASNGEEVIEKVEKHSPDILLLDITMPKKSGLDVISVVHNTCAQTKIIIVTMHRAHIYIDKSFELEVKGYLNKENVVEDLLPALRAVARGDTYVSSKVSQYLIERKLSRGETEDTSVTFSQREKDIIRLVVSGRTAKEIAKILFISPRTVENYKNSLLKKLGLNKTADLIKYAITHKIVEIEE